MLLVLKYAPSPSPSIHLLVEQAGGNGGPWPWLTSIAPFVVSLVALAGVIWSALSAARTTLKAEDKRAEAAIVAEDRRAAAAIAAENRRHANQLAHDDRRWRRDTTADAYFRVLTAAAAVMDACSQSRWFNRPSNEGGKYAPVNGESVLEQIDRWNRATGELKLLASTIRAIGVPSIADMCDRLCSSSQDALDAIDRAAQQANSEGTPYVEKAVAKAEFKRCFAIEDELIAAVRKELGAPEHASDAAAPN
jgi:hypothetical protein